ncbi:MAG: M20/M25/M40 family metallo-hydrolase [Clostridia bacterium]|nr:M20/M25/M40 family metallo-hydrolase [Clostridia bacterium]
MFTKEYIEAWAAEHLEELLSLHKELCVIPAPSHKEDKRAEFCKAWFDKNLGEGAYIDEALNVVYPYMAEGKASLSVLCAHTDTVFPDLEPMPFIDDGERLMCPGVGDDTASLAQLMLCARFFKEHKVEAPAGILFVANSCEEGLGNLKGIRRIFSDYSGRIGRLISFDAKIGGYTNKSVGSHRYLVELSTVGGHSWGAFGNRNAIAELSRIAAAIYDTVLPEKEGAKVTYNVGTIEGGTSVNTIAQSASMLCEYRSDDRELLAFMEARFNELFDAASKVDGVTLKVTKVGDRPCMGDVDPEALARLEAVHNDALSEFLGIVGKPHSGSTDCNIPHSLGIPAVSAGVYTGGGTHTREEWVDKASMEPGLKIGLRTALNLAELV